MRSSIAVLCLVALPAWAGLEPGNWEISASTTVQGISEPVTMTQTRCLNEADARDPGKLFGNSPSGKCQFTNRNDTGSVFTFEIVCQGQQSLRGGGAVRYSRDTLDGELELQMESLTTRSRIAGRRLGACQ